MVWGKEALLRLRVKSESMFIVSFPFNFPMKTERIYFAVIIDYQ